MSEMTTSVLAAPTTDMDTLRELADAARKQRKSAPYSGAGGDTRIPQKDILRRLNADQGGKNDAEGGMHRLFIPANQVNAYARKGYMPCMEGGQTVPFESDIAVEIPTEYYEDELAFISSQAARRSNQEMKKMRDMAKESGASKTTVGQLVTTGAPTPQRGRPRKAE